jgi:hypothetical protein
MDNFKLFILKNIDKIFNYLKILLKLQIIFFK